MFFYLNTKYQQEVNKEILSIDVQLFLKEHAGLSPAKVALKKSPFASVTSSELAEQVDSAQRLKTKLPHWTDANNIYFPPRQNSEQCSSEPTALYKAGLVSGKKAIDLTGGFGVDVWAFSQRFEHVDYCEMNEALFPIVAHNFTALDRTNVSCHLGDGVAFLATQQQYDLIYLDPARRDEHNRKMVSFADCLPNVVALQSELFEHADTVMVKASPMMDISLALDELQCVKEVHVVSLKNECKELLFVLQKGYMGDAKMVCVNLLNEGQQEFSFVRDEEAQSYAQLGDVKRYIYEPNTSLLKAGAFNILCERMSVKKLHSSTHLYTSDEKIEHFPGKIYEVSAILDYKKKEILKKIPSKKANIKTYNFVNTPPQVKKKLGLNDGGDTYLFGVKNKDDKYKVLLCGMF